MEANEYQLWTRTTAKYPYALRIDVFEAVDYLTHGITSEAGEVAGKFKKIIRDNSGVISEDRRAGLLAEVGDVLWYAARIADELGCPLTDVMKQNHDKLVDRAERDAIGGSGDHR